MFSKKQDYSVSVFHNPYRLQYSYAIITASFILNAAYGFMPDLIHFLFQAGSIQCHVPAGMDDPHTHIFCVC